MTETFRFKVKVCESCGSNSIPCECETARINDSFKRAVNSMSFVKLPEMEVEEPIMAHEFLEAGLGHMKDRATTYDAPQGERSMGKCVDMFRALTGIEITEEQGWKFMCCLKLVRSEQGAFRADNFEDLAAYAGLAGEAASNGGG